MKRAGGGIGQGIGPGNREWIAPYDQQKLYGLE